MTGLPNQPEMAQKFMAAVFTAGISGCDCKACVILRELGKVFSTPKPQYVTKSKKKR